VLFTFPSQYWFTIGLSGVFSLARWSWQIQTGFHVSRPTQDPTKTIISYIYGTVTLYGLAFQKILFSIIVHVVVLQPPVSRNYLGLGYSPFDRHYSGNHYCFLFLRVLRCFSSPGCHPASRMAALHAAGFPHSEISGSNSCLHLTGAYRSLPRPSSSLRA